ncbi:hypothetical protein [Paraburkholderia dioscoreae]|uniref:Uncharacterized protein n=1 Tax=Paraburkholderia dioscoreae TaxID=2604047 RepID=A0A5Q4ZH79_9BURK|nr:hypothetical protein [Paraburkholderia dioscoreae]VVD29174.1 protein of unknown function [Paraburkholderia dioscoreae]
MSTDVMTDNNYVGVLFADTAVLATLLALQVAHQPERDKAMSALKDFVHKSLNNIYSDQNVPAELAARVKMRVDNVFDVATHMDLG